VVEGEPVVPPSLATFAAWRSNHVDPNAGMRREWEACAPDGHESSEPEGEVARDDNGVVIEQLSRGTSSGFFLDAPAAAQVGLVEQSIRCLKALYYDPRQIWTPREHVNEQNRTGQVATSAFLHL